jgi:hypothetical protein
MAVRETELRRAAAAVVRVLREGDLLENVSEKPEALEQRVYDAFQKNLRLEAEIDAEAERMLKDLARQSVGMDQRKLLTKIKEKLAKDQGFVL